MSTTPTPHGDTRVVEYRRSSIGSPGRRPAERSRGPERGPAVHNHNGGLLLFGPGEAPREARRATCCTSGSATAAPQDDPHRNGQDLSTLLGKILRIDPRPSGGRPYSVPDSNPFVGRSEARPEIYSYGLRNPWRFSFDRQTGALAIGDVGQNEFEEVDLVAQGEGRGANFGWSAYEGFDRFNDDQQAPGRACRRFSPTATTPAARSPAATWSRDRALRSLYGRYLYGDFCAGELRSFTARPGRRATTTARWASRSRR